MDYKFESFRKFNADWLYIEKEWAQRPKQRAKLPPLSDTVAIRVLEHLEADLINALTIICERCIHKWGFSPFDMDPDTTRVELTRDTWGDFTFGDMWSFYDCSRRFARLMTLCAAFWAGNVTLIQALEDYEAYIDDPTRLRRFIWHNLRQDWVKDHVAPMVPLTFIGHKWLEGRGPLKDHFGAALEAIDAKPEGAISQVANSAAEKIRKDTDPPGYQKTVTDEAGKEHHIRVFHKSLDAPIEDDDKEFTLALHLASGANVQAEVESRMEADYLLNALPPDQRIALVLIASGRTVKQAADAVGVPYNTMKSRVATARKNAQRILASPSE